MTPKLTGSGVRQVGVRQLGVRKLGVRQPWAERRRGWARATGSTEIKHMQGNARVY